MSNLTIVRIEAKDYVLLRVSGPLDSDTASQLDAQCQDVATSEKNLIVNLANTSFITSSGIGVLLSTTELLRDGGFEFVCAEASHEVRTVFDLMNLNDFFTLADTEEEAFACLRKAA